MKHAIKQIYGPRDNRHYTSRRTSAIYFAATLTVLILLMLYMLFTSEWLVAFALFVAIASQVTLYIAFDGMSDKLWWNLVYKRFYGTEEPTAEGRAMKQFEDRPTDSNLQHLQKTIRRK
jgi:hypothetical protein